MRGKSGVCVRACACVRVCQAYTLPSAFSHSSVVAGEQVGKSFPQLVLPPRQKRHIRSSSLYTLPQGCVLYMGVSTTRKNTGTLIPISPRLHKAETKETGTSNDSILKIRIKSIHIFLHPEYWSLLLTSASQPTLMARKARQDNQATPESSPPFAHFSFRRTNRYVVKLN